MTEKKGLTLIELLVVLTIIGLMTVFAVPAFNNFGAKADISAKADEIKNAIILGYNQAKSPNFGDDATKVYLNTIANPVEISVKTGKIKNICSVYLNCEMTGTEQEFVPMKFNNKNYEIRNLCLNSEDGSDCGVTETGFFIKSPAQEEGDMIFDGESDSISFDLFRGDYGKRIEIIKYPFEVKIESI